MTDIIDNSSASKPIGRPSAPDPSRPGHFVQTERAAHEAWAHFSMKCPMASTLLHFLVARLDANTNAVVASHSTLAKVMGVTTRSIKNYLGQLRDDKWLQIVSLGPGSSNAYVVNSYVAWAKGRDKLKYSTFSAQVIASADHQDIKTLETVDLRSIPVMYEAEKQLPHGDGLGPPSQPSLDGLEPDLPAVEGDQHLQQDLLE